MTTNFSFGGFNFSFGSSGPDQQVTVPMPTQPTSQLYEILVGGQVPPNPQVFNQGLVDGPQDYTIDRKGDFIMKLVGAACILTVLLPLIIVVPLVVFDAASEFPTNSGSSGIDWGAVIFMAIFGLLFTAGAISLIVSALRRPRKVVFCVDPGAVLMEYGCKAPEVADLDDLGAPYLRVSNDHKNKHKLDFDLRIPRLAGGSDIAIELFSLKAHFKYHNGVSIEDEKKARELIDIAAKICHIFRVVKKSHEPVSIPLQLQFELSDLD
jgi:hypothetical protein